MSLLPVDLTELLYEELLADDRNDGLLHASSHLIEPLRHVQLELAGAPKIARSLGDLMTLKIGTLLHGWLGDVLRRRRLPFMAEVEVTPWLPKGWGGTADIVMWHPDYQAFVLADLKSAKGESIRWREQRGAKEEHRWQASMYFHGLRRMGLPMSQRLGIFYLPKNDTTRRGEEVEPVMVEFDPVPYRQLEAEAIHRRGRVEEYRDSLGPLLVGWEPFLTDALEPVPDRVQKVSYDRSLGAHVLKLVPHWTAQFCPFPDELCNCREHGETKLGVFDEAGDYYPRKGYENIEPALFPED